LQCRRNIILPQTRLNLADTWLRAALMRSSCLVLPGDVQKRFAAAEPQVGEK